MSEIDSCSSTDSKKNFIDILRKNINFFENEIEIYELKHEFITEIEFDDYKRYIVKDENQVIFCKCCKTRAYGSIKSFKQHCNTAIHTNTALKCLFSELKEVKDLLRSFYYQKDGLEEQLLKLL